jgi:hypothetical protein
MAEQRDPLDWLLLQAQQRQLSEDECNQIRRMVSRVAQDQPPQTALPSQQNSTTVPTDPPTRLLGPRFPVVSAADDPLSLPPGVKPPVRLAPRESIFKTGEATLARRQNVGEDQDPPWISEVLELCRQHMHPEAHAGLRAGLHGLHARGYAPAETETPRERGELIHEGPDGLPEPAMDALTRLPRRLFGFRQTNFGPEH